MIPSIKPVVTFKTTIIILYLSIYFESNVYISNLTIIASNVDQLILLLVISFFIFTTFWEFNNIYNIKIITTIGLLLYSCLISVTEIIIFIIIWCFEVINFHSFNPLYNWQISPLKSCSCVTLNFERVIPIIFYVLLLI